MGVERDMEPEGWSFGTVRVFMLNWVETKLSLSKAVQGAAMGSASRSTGGDVETESIED